MKILAISAFSAGLALAGAADAAVVVVDAFGNSSSGGTAASGGSFTAGQALNVSVAASDLWSAGALPRWSSADGIISQLIATGSDESGAAAGTVIGDDIFGDWTQNGLTAAYGSLVGEIGGVYKVLGTSFNGVAWNTGALNLYYWDSNFDDNAGSVTAMVSTVPEPASWALMIAGFGLAGSAIRSRKRLAVTT
jgi:hypothetical protein